MPGFEGALRGLDSREGFRRGRGWVGCLQLEPQSALNYAAFISADLHPVALVADCALSLQMPRSAGMLALRGMAVFPVMPMLAPGLHWLLTHGPFCSLHPQGTEWP